MKKSKRKPAKRKATHGDSDSRVNRQQMSVSNLTDPVDDVKYWRSRSPAARLAYVEYLRLINYGQAAISGRLKRVLEIAEFRSR